MSKEEFVEASMKRIEDFAKDCHEEISVMTKTAIHSELKTMFEAGKNEKSKI